MKKKQNKKQIVFLETFPTVMVYKIAKLFREKGYETILIVLLGSGASKDFHKNAFDRIIFFNLSFFKINLKNIPLIFVSLCKKMRDISKAIFYTLKLRPYLIFTRAAPSWPCAVMMSLFNKTPLIYFTYDIRTHYFETPEQAIQIGKIPRFEIKAERFCFEHANALMHKGNPDELEYVNGRMLGENIKFPKLQIHFFPYCSKEFTVPLNKNKLSKKDKEIHMVYIGSMGSVGPSGATYVFDDIKSLIKQKIHVHVYTRPNSVSVDEIFNFFKEDNNFTRAYKDIIKSKYFHVHAPVEPNELALEISKYDFGIWPAETEATYSIEPSLAMGNKLSSYLEAGIPFISNEAHKFINKKGAEYGICIPYNLESIKKIKTKIKKLDYKKLEKNILKARKDFDMDKNFPRLEKFFKEVVALKN